MKKTAIILSLLVASTGVAHAKRLPKPLGVALHNVTIYACADNTKLQVRYYSLSDNSLDFVKVNLNGKIYTLPHAVSASGAKYSDWHQLTWWTKGDEGTVYAQNDGPEDTWPAQHADCRAIQ